jgi:hypothetical protein
MQSESLKLAPPGAALLGPVAGIRNIDNSEIF